MKLTNTGSSAAAQYITRPIVLDNQSTALEIRLTSNIRSSSEVEVYFRTSSEEVRNIEDLDFVPFNSDGSEDVTVTPAEDDETFKEYKYSATGLNDFTSFQLKIVMKGTISSYPPRIRDMRGIALNIMSRYLKVEGHTSLVRDTYSNGIVNTNVNEYQIYMQRVKSREQQGDEIRNAVKEINTLKQN